METYIIWIEAYTATKTENSLFNITAKYSCLTRNCFAKFALQIKVKVLVRQVQTTENIYLM